MAPTDEKAYDDFRNKHRIPPHYQRFAPLIYSIENCVPIVKLGQDSLWQPDPDPNSKKGLVPFQSHNAFVRKLNEALDRLARLVPKFLVQPVALKWYRWFMIVAGWLLATFFIAGLTGLIKAN
jgi:hypothetical protein